MNNSFINILIYAFVKMKRYILLVNILFFINTSFSITQPLLTERLNTTDGLSNNWVRHIFQDSYGLIWIGTEYGLNLYDGYSFKVFKNDPGNPESINSNVIWWIVEDEENNLWISTGEGVSKYLRAENKFKNYDLYGNYYSTLKTYIDLKGNIWAGVEGENILKYNKENDSWDKQKFALIDSSRRYDVNSQAIVQAITEDVNNKLWVGSFYYGLMWYDENEKVFRQSEIINERDASDFTLIENRITSLYSDSTGVLWITTRKGIYKYNPASKELKTIKKYSTDQLSYWNNWNSITQDEMGNIWIANNFNGCLKFEGISDEFNRIEILNQNYSRKGISDIILTRILWDRTGILWIGSMTQGVFKYDPNKKLFAHYKHNEKDKNSVSNSQIFSLLESTVYPGKIYVGTRGGGLNIFDTRTKSFSKIPFDVFEDVYGGSVRSILEEEDGSLWLGTWGDGLLKMDPQRNVIKRFCPDSTTINCLSDGHVKIIRKDSSGNFWIGTGRGGLNYMDLKAKTITRHTRDYACYSQELIDLVISKINLNLDKAKIIKVGNLQNLSAEFEIYKPGYYLIVTAGEGLLTNSLMWDYGWIEDKNERTVWSSEEIDSTYHIGGASKNRIKIETLQLNPGKYSLKYKSDESHCFGSWNMIPPIEPHLWGIRILEIDNKSELERIRMYLTEPERKFLIQGRDIRALHLSKNNIVWVGTYQYGLYKINKSENTIKTYILDNENKNSLSDISINDIYEDNDGILWITTNHGLTKFDPVKETFTTFTEKDGLPTNYISSILPGDNKELWLSTINGISKMTKDENTGKVTFANFGMDDGLGGMDFVSLVALKTYNGKCFFGGRHGLNEFSSKSLISKPPNLLLTDLKISNKSVLGIGENSPLDTSLYDLTSLSLSYTQNDLTFEYAALHYSDPKKNKYAHKLEGYEEDWIYDNRRIATYTNLDPGEYTFKFKGSNRDGIWNEKDRSISIIISPPFWQTWWAYTIYMFSFIGLLVGLRRIDLNRRKEKEDRRILELENERKTKELEEARALQLSMLPTEVPQIPHLDIALYMKTATEVGGDYYDFHIDRDGTLTVIIGDATGHGMNAGMMVCVTKGLFQNLAGSPDLEQIFHQFNKSIYLMELLPLMMSMLIFRVKGKKLEIINGGMPDLLIYRHKNNLVDEIKSSGPPLGAYVDYTYDKYSTEIDTDDVVLSMSDGFAERFNENNEMIGYDKCKDILKEVVFTTSCKMIEYFNKKSDDWAGTREQDDDMTFIILKYK